MRAYATSNDRTCATEKAGLEVEERVGNRQARRLIGRHADSPACAGHAAATTEAVDVFRKMSL